MNIRYTELLKTGNVTEFANVVHNRLDQLLGKYLEPKVNQYKHDIGKRLSADLMKVKLSR